VSQRIIHSQREAREDGVRERRSADGSGFADAAADRQEVAAVRAEKNAGRLGDRPAKARAGTRPCGGYFRRKVQPAVATRPFGPARSSETPARPWAKGLRAGAATPSAPT